MDEFHYWLEISTWGNLLLLIALEMVLGIDNLLLLSLVAARLPESQRQKARTIGLTLAVVLRLALLAAAGWLTSLTATWLTIAGEEFSGRDLVLLAGGAFLLYKAVKEMHHVVNASHGDLAPGAAGVAGTTFASAITTIVFMDAVFSIDSVITAVGMTKHFSVMAVAVIVSIGGMIFYAGWIGQMLERYPGLKVLALAFLLSIAITLVMEAFEQHVPKQYLYLPMGFALAVELLQIRQSENLRRQREAAQPPAKH